MQSQGGFLGMGFTPQLSLDPKAAYGSPQQTQQMLPPSIQNGQPSPQNQPQNAPPPNGAQQNPSMMPSGQNPLSNPSIPIPKVDASNDSKSAPIPGQLTQDDLTKQMASGKSGMLHQMTHMALMGAML